MSDKLDLYEASMDYRELRGLVNKTHARFSEINFDESLSLLQKTNLLAEHFKSTLDDFQRVLDYLDLFSDNFDENLFKTTYEILELFNEMGVLNEVIQTSVFKELTEKYYNLEYSIVDQGSKYEYEIYQKRDKDKAINMSDLDEDVKKALTGNATLGVLDDDSVYTNNVRNKNITNLKLDLPENQYLPMSTSFTKGEATNPANQRRIFSELLVLKQGTVIKSINGSDFYVYFKKSDGEYGGSGGWITEFTVYLDTVGYIISRATTKDDAIIPQKDVKVLENNFYYITPQNYLPSDIYYKYAPKEIKMRVGYMDVGGLTSNKTRMVSTQYYKCTTNDKLTFRKSDNLEYTCVYVDEKGNFVKLHSGWVSTPSIEISQDGYMYIVGRNIDNKDVTESMLKEFEEKIFFDENKNFVVGRASNNNNVDKDNFIYVSNKGDDSNSGSKNSPVKTIDKALSLSSKILIENGIYYGTINIDTNSDVFISSYGGSGVEILGGTHLTSFVLEENLKVFNYSVKNNFYTKVFIEKTLPPETTSSRPSYNAGLWSKNNDIASDIKLKPVLTKEECKNTPNSFYYDGFKVYVNSTSNRFYTVEQVTNTIKAPYIQLNGISFKYYDSYPLNINNNPIAHLYDCEASYSMKSDGFKCDNTNATFKRCRAYKNRNDGYNFHFKGDTLLLDCIGSYNYDDGASHHEDCKGQVIGGEYAYNGKGGIASPTYEAQVSIDGVYLHHNVYNIYASADNKVNYKIIVKNSLLTNATRNDIRCDNYDMLIFNTHLGTTGKEISSSNANIERIISNG